jgi:hypothetical protein
LGYPQLSAHMAKAGLDPSVSYWNEIFDFNKGDSTWALPHYKIVDEPSSLVEVPVAGMGPCENPIALADGSWQAGAPKIIMDITAKREGKALDRAKSSEALRVDGIQPKKAIGIQPKKVIGIQPKKVVGIQPKKEDAASTQKSGEAARGLSTAGPSTVAVMQSFSLGDMEKDDAVTKGAARVSKLVLACGLDVRGSMSRSDLAGWLAKLGESKIDAEVSAEDMAPKGSIPVTELVEMLELLATCGDAEAEEKLRCLEQSVGLAPAKKATAGGESTAVTPAAVKPAARLDPADFRFVKQKGVVLVKKPGDVNGIEFCLDGLEDCDVFILDHCSQLTMDDCTNCHIVVGPVDGAFFIRNCRNCVVTVACRQFRARYVCTHPPTHPLIHKRAHAHTHTHTLRNDDVITAQPRNPW